jgi:MazG family protein
VSSDFTLVGMGSGLHLPLCFAKWQDDSGAQVDSANREDLTPYHSRVPEELLRLVKLVERLRRECPWDREQTPETLRTYLLEECYEVLEAIDGGQPSALADELGDLLFQILFLARIAEERGWFAIADVAGRITRKMIERHPHVFAGGPASDAEEVRRGWERRKERSSTSADPLGSLPASLPALASAYRMTSRAADLGFDWERDTDVAAKIEEELAEWREAERSGDRQAEEKEIGDLLFSIVNLARRRGVDPESALRRSQARFRRRFSKVAERARESGRAVGEVSAAELDEYWEAAKAEE